MTLDKDRVSKILEDYSDNGSAWPPVESFSKLGEKTYDEVFGIVATLTMDRASLLVEDLREAGVVQNNLSDEQRKALIGAIITMCCSYSNFILRVVNANK